MTTHTTKLNTVFIYEIEPMNTRELCEALMSFDERFLVRRTDTIITNYHNGEPLRKGITKIVIETTEEICDIPDCVKYVNNYVRKAEISVSN